MRKVKRTLKRELAEPFRDKCEELVRFALRYANKVLNVVFHWEESPSRKLSYQLDHPENWNRAKLGTALRALLSYQRTFLLEVIPHWVFVHQSGEETTGGLNVEQVFQSGWDPMDALDDLSNPQWPGLGRRGSSEDEEEDETEGPHLFRPDDE